MRSSLMLRFLRYEILTDIYLKFFYGTDFELIIELLKKELSIFFLKAPNQSKASFATNVTNTLNNTQLLSAFATMMQQTRSDSICQQQCVADSLTAANLSSKQQTELLSQYQLTLNNLAK